MRQRLPASVYFVCVALCAATLAQTTKYIVPEYLKPQYTAPENAPASIVIAGKDEPGARMVVTGRTLIGDKPVAGVSLYVFHTDTNGKYSTTIYDQRRAEYNPRLHGALRTDTQGRYRYETVRPGSYDNQPAHVHYVVKADGYESLLLALQFQDDPIAIETLKANPQENWAVLTQPVVRDAQGVSHVVRDIQMVKK